MARKQDGNQCTRRRKDSTIIVENISIIGSMVELMIIQI